VPAVLGYNYLLGRNKLIMERVKLFANDLEQVIVSGSRVEGLEPSVISGARSNRGAAREAIRMSMSISRPAMTRTRRSLRSNRHAARRRDAGAADHLLITIPVITQS